jgi:hypothetical protein
VDAMDVRSPLKFILSGYGQEQSIRARELEASSIRSHASRISHRRIILKRSHQPTTDGGHGSYQFSNGSFSGPGNVDLLDVPVPSQLAHAVAMNIYPDAVRTPADDSRASNPDFNGSAEFSDHFREPGAFDGPTSDNNMVEGAAKVDKDKKDAGPDKLGAEQLIRDSWMNAPIERWGKGQRLDPFNCIPGSDQEFARIGLDFRRYRYHLVVTALTLVPGSDSDAMVLACICLDRKSVRYESFLSLCMVARTAVEVRKLV